MNRSNPVRILSIVLFITLCTLYVLSMSGHLFSPDGEILYRTAVSLVEGRGGAIEAIRGVSTVPGPDGQDRVIVQSSFGTRTGRDGREYPQYGIGQPLLATPLAALGRGVTLDPDRFAFLEIQYQIHDLTPSSFGNRFVVSLFNPLVASLTGVVLFLFVYSLLGDKKIAVLAALLYGTATIAWPHGRTFFSEPLSGLSILLSYYFAFWGARAADVRGERGAPPPLLPGLLSGAAFGYGLLTRPDSLLFLPGVLLMIVSGNSPGDRAGSLPWIRSAVRAALLRWRAVAAFATPIAVAVGITLWLNLQRFGGPFESGYSDQPEAVRFVSPVQGLVGFVFSTGRSIFLYSPPLALSIPGWRRLWRIDPRTTAALAAGTGCFVLFEAAWQNWSGGWDWGPRHVFQVAALWMLPAAAYLLYTARKHGGWGVRLIWICASIGVTIQVLGVSVDFLAEVGRLSARERAFVLYDPALSGPWLHLRALLDGRHDLYWLHQWLHGRDFWGLALIPVLAAGVAGLWRGTRSGG